MILTQPNNLRRFGEGLSDEGRRIELVVQNAGVLPERLVDQVISVGVDRSDCDVPFGFGAAQYIGAKHDDITYGHGFLPELTEQDRRTITYNDDLHAVECQWSDGSMYRLGPSEENLVLDQISPHRCT
ncbi:hypothetical protein [Nesterenkonia aerolata]|uniref:Uncharacterized protein n=1 Tax=Nesterenkonia aerolata TaxID=3074079 RepID=A0ABU2DUR1_9MICC|nr:hypothetical protein [Nesterenkonia sp. LY-0111]MDR8020020.1 hypothetical protein [Nesterenkonia sp. LY-0111]